MSIDSIPAAMAAEHQKALLRQADAYRRGRQARDGGQAPASHRHRRRPMAVRIRPIRTTDAQLIQTGFARLSERSRWLRFLSFRNELSPAEVRYFTDVDHHDHEALLAVSRLTGKGFGVARYVRYPNDPELADLAVTVADEWQGRGVGNKLVRQLSDRALCEGIRRFTALLSADNAGARALLRHVPGELRLVARESGTLTYEILLTGAATARRRRFGLRMAGTPGPPCAGAA